MSDSEFEPRHHLDACYSEFAKFRKHMGEVKEMFIMNSSPSLCLSWPPFYIVVQIQSLSRG